MPPNTLEPPLIVVPDDRVGVAADDTTSPLPPLDDIDLELAYMGGEDFSMSDFAATLEKMSELHCDILLPGHYYVYYGDVDALCRRAASMVKSMMEGKEND